MDFKTLFSQTGDLSLLLVEDYAPLRNDMAEMFDDLFGSVTTASNGSKALDLYREHYAKYSKNFDLVITDIQMPVMNGVELSEALYNIHADQQIIVLSAHTDSDYLLGLINIGIAQFITKPIKHEELMDTLFRVGKKINTREQGSNIVTEVNLGENYSWDKKKHILKDGADIIDLTRHELLLMQLLTIKSEQVCTNDDIIQEFYAYDIDIYENNIRNLVFKLRKKLPDKLISSIYGMGYMLTPAIDQNQ
jgi:DNA-binding response OmpR family regulator